MSESGHGADTAVIVHAYYPEMWTEIDNLLKNIDSPFDLFVTVPADVDIADSHFRSTFPQASIRRCENRGRDIAPFLTVFAEIFQAGYQYICKLHTKKSRHTRHGASWRQEMLNALVGSTDVVSRIRAAFREHSDWGLIAPAGHVLPHLYCWPANSQQVIALASSVGVPADSLDFTFPAGSMFWCRPQALSLLQRTGLTTQDFDPEEDQTDGTMAHAVERLIGLAVRHAGFEIAESDSHGVRPSHVSVHFRILLEQLAGKADGVEYGAADQPAGSGGCEAESATNTPAASPVSIQALKDAHAGDTAWIVGKGPSLLMLTREQLGPGPVIAINESVIVVEALGLDNAVYSLQKDAVRYGDGPGTSVVARGGEAFAPLRAATLLVHRHESANRMIDYAPRFVFDNVIDFGIDWWEFSSLTAVAIARLMGCLKVVFVSHDACLLGDTRTCVPNPNGSFQIYTDAESAAEYPQHRQRIEDYLARVSMEADWLIPEAERAPHKRVVAELTARADLLRGERDAAIRENNALRATLAGAEDRIRALLDSTSWRWTAPFRAAHDLLARVTARDS